MYRAFHHHPFANLPGDGGEMREPKGSAETSEGGAEIKRVESKCVNVGDREEALN